MGREKAYSVLTSCYRQRAILQTLNAQHPTPSLRFGLGDEDDDDDVFSRAMVPTRFPGEVVDDRDSLMGAGGLLSRVWGLRRRKDADESMLDSVGRRPRWQFRWARKSE
jgi:hypothetical protein